MVSGTSGFTCGCNSTAGVQPPPLMLGGPTEDPVESLTVRIANLELTISVRHLSPRAPSSTAFELVPESSSVIATPGPALAPEEPLVIFDFSPALESQAIAARGPRALEALPLSFLHYLVVKLRSGAEGWTPKARIARAFRAGVLAGKRLSGDTPEESSPSIPLRNIYYICLRRAGGGPGFWTCDYGGYIRAVGSPEGGFDSRSISHSFPTRAESEAFLVGAKRPWPQEL